jgi:hypothetical protein
VDVWDRFGRHLATTETAEPGGVAWSGETESGARARPGAYIVRMTAGEEARSQTVVIEG